jgi:DUF1009 family protein
MSLALTPSSLTILPDPPAPPAGIGLIAGSGLLPIMVAKGLREMGHKVHGLGLANQYDPQLPKLCESFAEVGVLRLGSWGRTLQGWGVRHAIMVGRVDKAKLMHDPWRLVRNLPDIRTARMWFQKLRHDKRSHRVLRAVADELHQFGVALLDSTIPIPDEMAHVGVMTRTQPTPEQKADIDFAWSMMNDLLRLDIGQSLAIRERDVIAVEAVEGTDKMIERVARLCRARGWTLCKGARVGHDRRSDVPTIGSTTIEKLAAAGGGCIALAAGDVIMLEKERVIDLADELGVSIVGVPQVV